MPLLGPTLLDYGTLLQMQRQRAQAEQAAALDQELGTSATQAANTATAGITDYFQKDKAQRDARQQQAATMFGQAAGISGQPAPSMTSPELQETTDANAALQGAQQHSLAGKLQAQYGWHGQQLQQQLAIEQQKRRDAEQKMLNDLGIAQQKLGDTDAQRAINDAREREIERHNLEMERIMANRAAANQGRPGNDWDNVLAKQFQNEQAYKDMQVVASQYKLIKGARENGTDDLALLTSFMRMTDPRTGVRPSEMAMAQQVGNLYDQAVGYAQRLASDKAARLPDNVRQMFKATAQQMLNEYGTRYNSVANKWKQRAVAKGADPEWVIGQDQDIIDSMSGIGTTQTTQQQGQQQPRADGKIHIKRNGVPGWILPQDVKPGDVEDPI